MNYKATYYRIILKDNREIVVTDVMSISVILMIGTTYHTTCRPNRSSSPFKGFYIMVMETKSIFRYLKVTLALQNSGFGLV